MAKRIIESYLVSKDIGSELINAFSKTSQYRRKGGGDVSNIRRRSDWVRHNWEFGSDDVSLTYSVNHVDGFIKSKVVYDLTFAYPTGDSVPSVWTIKKKLDELTEGIAA